MKHLILATAGHVDHGKSALVRALSGTDPDRLPEEKARGITIELGFAELELPGPNGSEAIHLGLIDVPGHEDFVKNMVAGIGSVDLALLVIAADDGWMPQTEEHLQILSYMGVQHAVVALAKADLATDRAASIAAVRERLQDSPFAGAPIVATAIGDAATLADLRAALAVVCGQVRAPVDIGKPRLPVDRAFSLHGVGTVVTGTLTGGWLTSGEPVIVQPSGALTRIRALQSHGRELTKAGPGRRVALHLADLPIAAKRGDPGVRRGDVITLSRLGSPATRIDVQLVSSTRTSRHEGRRLLRTGTMVRVHHGSGNMQARVRLLGVEELNAGGMALARLNFDSPVFTFVGDRFIVRDSSGDRTLAGGLVLDTAPPAVVSPAHRNFLAARAGDPSSPDHLIRAEVVRDGATKASEILLQSRFDAREIQAAISRLALDGALVRRGDLLADADWWSSMLEKAKSLIEAEHGAHPEHVGLSLAHLRSGLPAEWRDVAEQLVESLCDEGYSRAGNGIKRTSHHPGLPPALQAAGARVRSALTAKPLEPPARKELCSDGAARQALQFLIETGEVVEISAELAMDAGAFEQAKRHVAERLQRCGPATASELREALGTSRRVVIPLLERIDKEGLTRRVGDKRVFRTA